MAQSVQCIFPYDDHQIKPNRSTEPNDTINVTATNCYRENVKESQVDRQSMIKNNDKDFLVW